MSCFTTMTAVTAGTDLDLTKHVNYTAGMILGVDDFTQEFAYLSGRDRWLARDAIGYGTISGLSIGVEKDGDKGFRVMIAPGVAISPRGQLICVSSAQCAYFNQWLAAADLKELEEYLKNGDISSPPVTSPPADDAELSLYVVLCYRDCPTDNVPIPGEPCRNENELSAASRIKDDFSLELRFAPPKHAEEEAVKKFAAWIREIEVVETGDSTEMKDFVRAIREKWLATAAVTSPPEITSPPITSPPTELQINKDDVGEYLRTAFRIWVTELRSVLSERKTGCSVEMTSGGKLEDCVLLGEIKLNLTAVSPGWKTSDTEEPLVIEKERPYLVHLRMLQEWISGGDISYAGTTIPITSPPITSPPIIIPPIITPPVTSPPEIPPHTHKLSELEDVAFPSRIGDGQILTFRRGRWTAADPPVSGGGGVTDHGALSGLQDDDHDKYLLADGTRALTGDLNGGGKRITNLAAANANGQAVIFQQAIKQNDAAGGDLGGTYPNPAVVKLQGFNVDDTAPNEDDSLVWNGSSWSPKRVTGTPQAEKPFLILPLANIIRREQNLGNRVGIFYEIWMNIDAPGNLAEMPKLDKENLSIVAEMNTDTNNPQTFMIGEIEFAVLPQQFRNVFTLQLRLEPRQSEPNYLRFRFNMVEKTISFRGKEISLAEYAEKNDIKFHGFEGSFATVFVRGAELKLG